MATILIETKLDVIEKQRKLVEEALGPDSIYIKVVVRLSAQRLDFYNCRPAQSQFAFHKVPRYNYDLIIFDKTY